MTTTFQTRSSARRGSLATSRPIISCMPSPATSSSTVLRDMPKMRSPNCSSPSCRATTTKKASEASFPTTSPVDRASVPNAIRCDADPSGFRSGLIGGATLGDSPYGSKPRAGARARRNRGLDESRAGELRPSAGQPRARHRLLHAALPDGRAAPHRGAGAGAAAARAGWTSFTSTRRRRRAWTSSCDLDRPMRGLAARLGEHALVLVCGVIQYLRDLGRAVEIAVQALAPGGLPRRPPP